MGKKQQPADKNPATPDQPARKSKKKTGSNKATARGIQRFMLISAAMTVLWMGALGAGLSYLHQSERERNANQAAQALVLQPATLLSQAINLSQASVETLAASYAVREALASGRSPEVVSQQLSSQLPASRVHLIRVGELPRATLSFTARDLVQQAHEHTPPVVLLPGSTPQLLFARRTPDGQGILLVEQDLSETLKHLRRLDMHTGGVRIVQAGTPVLQLGNPQGPERATIQASGGLTLTYLGTPGGDFDETGPLAMLAFGCVLVLILLGQWLVLRAISAGISRDAGHLQQHAQEAGRAGAGIGRRYTFSALEAVRDQLDKLAGQRRASRPVSTATGSASAAGKASPPPDAFLDILVEDDAPLIDDTPARQIALPDDIFRASDIRGVVGRTLTPDMVELLGQAIGSEAGEQGQHTVLVARDGRTSSDELSQALMRGLVRSGREVLDIGAMPSPVLYYGTAVMDTQTGVVVTGSHNPSTYNGLKIIIGGETLGRERLLALKTRIEEDRLSEGLGDVIARDISERYLHAISDDILLARPLKVVVDCGNGITGVIAPQLFQALGCEVLPLFAEVDGHFPNHHPDPGRPENLHALIQAVKQHGADIGIAFDGDGDRLGVVTPAGEIIWPDRLLMLYVRDLLTRSPGADILYDVKCSRELTKLISRMGGRPLMVPSGYAQMKATLRETGAPLAGELSGHIFFADRWHGVEDALYAAARLLEILALESVGADSVFARLKTGLVTPELLIPASDTGKFELMDKLLARQSAFADGSVTTLDGLRVDFDDGWGLVRASNTVPALSVRFEGRDKAALQRIAGLFRTELQAIEPKLKLPF
jgi:phosphomannomutase / phosphoglucomutase